MLFTPCKPCKINNKELRPNSRVCHGHVRNDGQCWCSLNVCRSPSESVTLHHATVLQTSSATGQLAEDSQCTLQSLCEYFVNMYMTDLAFLLCGCVWGSETTTTGSQLLLKPESPRSSLLPRSFDRNRGDSHWEETLGTVVRMWLTVRYFSSTCWTCESGLAVAQISQPGREGLLMKVHDGQAHSVCWKKLISSYWFKKQLTLNFLLLKRTYS